MNNALCVILTMVIQVRCSCTICSLDYSQIVMDDHHMTASLQALKYVKNVTYSAFKLKGAEVLGDNFKHSRRHGGFRRGTCILDRTTENWGQWRKKRNQNQFIQSCNTEKKQIIKLNLIVKEIKILTSDGKLELTVSECKDKLWSER